MEEVASSSMKVGKMGKSNRAQKVKAQSQRFLYVRKVGR